MNMTKMSAKYSLLLGGVALACTALSTGIYFLTKDKIDEVVAKQQQALLSEVIPAQYHDNDLLQSCYDLEKSALKNSSIGKICVAKKDGKISAYAYETVAPDGYSGNIRLLVGLTPQGDVLGVRVIEHAETPGLGDKIELRISDWILSLSNQKISQDTLSDWAVKKDGGKFDQFAGATITPRAVVNQVKHSALFLLDELRHHDQTKRLNEK
ncbi:electron transport complex subunit RsxG [Actinobacillus seminis]|uniref:Ion-translocating oxidoreductase complex subunit G n=1 Tax=Actinobacillus seminis TaxID=722 RepID=A0A263HC05_9PAST|nr:electron transport complex subunit RsxG [Actinobacillus seminis]OZN24970.1 electron transport complex subunit RsxG [Actinobacillus seminis]SUU36349.1 electron transport complex protein RnfG [Actinobacillus seminis]